VKREDYDLNGGHRLLGKAIDNAEFKGFVVAKISDIEKVIGKLEPRVSRNEKILYLATGGFAVVLIAIQVL